MIPLIPVAIAALRGIASVGLGLMARRLTWGGILVASAVPTAIATAEYATDGAVSQNATKAAIATIRAGIRSGAFNAQTMESQIDNVATIMGISNVLNKTAQNQTVSGILASHENPKSADAISHAKTAALSWMFLPHNATTLLAKTEIRSQLIDDIYTDKKQADRHLAEKLIDDLVSSAQVNALGDHKITRDDVKIILQKELSKPDSHLANIFKNSRVGNGLKQIWPDINQPAPAPAFIAAPTEKNSQRKPGSISETFHQKAEEIKERTSTFVEDIKTRKDDLVSNNMNMLMAIPVIGPIIAAFMFVFNLIKDIFGGNNNVSAQTDNPSRLAALREQHGGQMPSIHDHEGTRFNPAPPVPAPAFALRP